MSFTELSLSSMCEEAFIYIFTYWGEFEEWLDTQELSKEKKENWKWLLSNHFEGKRTVFSVLPIFHKFLSFKSYQEQKLFNIVGET